MEHNIRFAKPNWKQLKQEGFTMVDMHFHTNYSDGISKVSNILKKAKKLGVNIAITDHNEIKGNILAQKQKDVMVIPGIEVSTKHHSHILFYFYDKSSLEEFYEKEIKNYKGTNQYLSTTKTAEELVDAAKKYNALICPAHPVVKPLIHCFEDKIRKKIVSKDILKDIHAIEVICGMNLRGMNKKAIAWNKEIKKGIIGGSDGHVLASLGCTVTYSEASDLEDFLDSIMKKENFVVGKEISMPWRLFPYTTLSTKHAKFIGPAVKTGYGNRKRAMAKRLSSLNEKRKQKIEALKNCLRKFKK